MAYCGHDCRPIEHGADLVMHSATKQLNGHADVLAGALVTARRDDFWDRIVHDRGCRGAVLGPFEAWLLLRGMRTLFLRVPRSAASAQLIAERLASHPAVVEVFYPGLTSHPDHAVAARQMSGGFGMLLSFRVAGGAAEARRVAGVLRLFKNATSLGGVESLVEHRAPVEGPGTPVPDDLLRLSIGIEAVAEGVTDQEIGAILTATAIRAGSVSSACLSLKVSFRLCDVWFDGFSDFGLRTVSVISGETTSSRYEATRRATARMTGNLRGGGL